MERKSLICITTCNRLSEVKKYILPYIDFCNNHQEFDFLLALDGNNQEYIVFCNEFQIPLLYSEEREGVGLSKNRVLTQFPDYHYYFFIDDDIELINNNVFIDTIKTSETIGIPHLSGIVFGEQSITSESHGIKIIKGYKAGGYFNFFKAEYLFKVGGWHTHFAPLKRYGHSEHSYRFFNAGFQDYPLITTDLVMKGLAVHNPPHVTNENQDHSFDHFHPQEKEIMNERLIYFPLCTLSAFHFNGFNSSYNHAVNSYLRNNKRKYPLNKSRERLRCFSEYYFFKFSIAQSIPAKCLFFCIAFIFQPFNNQIKHYIKRHFKKNQ